MPNFIDYGTHDISLDIRKLERWALEREQHDENYDDFVRKLSDKICAIEKKLENSDQSIYEKIHQLGGCDASDEWSKGWDAAITEVLNLIEKTHEN